MHPLREKQKEPASLAIGEQALRFMRLALC